VLTDFDVADALLRSVMAVSRADRPRFVRAPSDHTTAEGHVVLMQKFADVPDTLLQLDVQQLALSTTAIVLNPEAVDADPKLRFDMRVTARFLRVVDRSVLLERQLEHHSIDRLLSVWADGEGRALRNELDDACQKLAARIVDESF
jgi:hypothetical protein